MTKCHFDADVAPWVLSALDDANAAQFQVHIRSCHSCQQAIDEFSLVVDQLPMAAVQIMPSPDLGTRIMAEVKSDPRSVTSKQERTKRTPFWARDRSWRLSPLPAAGLATVLLALGVFGGSILDGGEVNDNQRTLAFPIAPPGADARLVVDKGGKGTIVLDDMPQAPSGRVYQVWLKRGKGAPRPTHTLFTVREDGRARVQIDEPVAPDETVLVTSEPDGGSETPSSAPVLATPV